MQNWDLIGHSWAVDYLRHSTATGRGAHAYLFAGATGIGKALLALRLAQRLVCETNGPDPCLVCRACKRVEHGNHPDVRWSSLAQQSAESKEDTKSRELKIDTVRAWQHDIDMRPYEAARRVFVLDDANTLTEQAANALLKTLEEPPPYAVLILIAQGAGDLLPTVVSRCRVLKLRPVGRSLIAAALIQRFNVSSGDAELLAAWSGGRIGWAIRLLDQPELIEQQQARLDVLAELQAAGHVARLKWAEERAKEYRSDHEVVSDWLTLWQSWWRDILLLGAHCGDAITHLDRREDLQVLASATSLADAQRFLTRLDTARQQLADNVNPQLALEHLVLHLP
ncbi:MAG: DNA polymerase III subunit delta' [Herpetosiphonaceae bacterium]|nr:DNA polymerase III subunit delta' [Herpetosiphonaceae bacterium]